ncbi:MAG: M3 family metallopeptidase [Prevotellaceae bacterium]|jgi:peptidyl-dipeptidase Dcp|nr:M3 family metallopeptidase [Prevotellaceae bacterium]
MKKLTLLMLLAALGLSACQQKETNPLLAEWNTPFGIPPFEQIKLEHYMPAIEEGMRQQKAEIDAIVNNPDAPTFANTIEAYDAAGALLSRIMPIFSGISGANTTPEMQVIERELSPKMTAHNDDIRLNEGLFQRIKTVYEQREELTLDAVQMRLLEEMYKGFERSGANLSPEQKEELRRLNTEISKLQTQFGQNMLAETAAYTLLIDNEADLAGLPEALRAAAAARAAKVGHEGKWLFGLDNPSIMPFLQYTDNRELRRQMLDAYLNRCNNNNDNDSKEVVHQIVNLRLEKAKLMGFINFAEMTLENRMAKTPTNVYDLLDKLWTPTMKVANREAAELQKMMNDTKVAGKLEASDWRYYSEKVKGAKYAINEEMLSPYFKHENVRDGIFYVCNRLYGITFTQVNVSVPTDETVAYECKDADGTHLGILYMDMFSRPGAKRGGAWCGRYRSQTYENGKRVAPLVTIVCNFTRPVGDKPALFSPDEVGTFFHEFGHALHGLLSDTRYNGLSVPRDFVELPSQIMEHWSFEPEVLNQYAKHYETGEIIPQELVDKFDKAEKFGEGFRTAEYLAASYLDMDYHVLTAIPGNLNLAQFEIDVLNNKRGLTTQIPPRYRSTYFNHTMGGGYTAGYYSYIWAGVLDCDAYNAFVEAGDIFDKTVATKFRKEILERGGDEDAMQMYLNFRGKAPMIEPLLDNRGLR